MGRKPAPNYWKRERAWFCRINGVLHRLSGPGPMLETKAEAERKFHALMAGSGQSAPVRTKLTVPLACELFLAHSKLTHTPASYDQYRIKLNDLAYHFHSMLFADLRPSHVTRWLSVHGDEWGQATHRQAITYAKTLGNWLVKERLIEANPIKDVVRPAMPQRKGDISTDQKDAILEAATEPFRSFLVAMIETGARVSEIFSLEAGHFDWERGVAILPGKTTRKTGRPRVLPITQRMAELCKPLAAKHPTGPLFRNSDGTAWTYNTVRCRMRRLKLPKRFQATLLRHAFTTNALERGISPALVAEIQGNSLRMIEAHYSKLNQRTEAIRKAAEAATSRPDEDPHG